ncbi:MAG: AAA family ATPase [Gammaproteobacteria bacterium]|nr:AAA family ATPase [Gammaproteobacteria bacterium]
MSENALTEPTLFSAAWRYRWLVAITTLVALGLGIAFVMLRPPKTIYTARASLVVQATAGGLDLGTSGNPQRFVANQVEILRSAAVSELASQILEQQDPPIVLTPEDVTASLQVESSSNSDLIDVVFSAADDPVVAVRTANAVVEAYRQLVASEKTAVTAAALERIDAQLVTLDERAQTLASQIADRLAKDTALIDLRSEYEDAIVEVVLLEREAQTADITRLEEIRARLGDLRNLIATYRSVRSIGRDDPELDALQGEQDQILTRRDALLERRDSISIDVELSPDVVAFSSPAQVAMPSPDSGPGRALAVAIMLGLFGGVGLAYLFASRVRVFHDRMEPQVILGAPLLADIPDFTQEGLKTLLPVRDEPRSASAEAFRFAAASLELKMTRQNAKSLAIISPTLGAGKSTVLANAALAAARQGNRVLLIDADFGNQVLTALLAGDEGTQGPGLTEVVGEGLPLDRAIRRIQVGPDLLLSLLSRGRQPVAAADLLRSREARGLFDTAKEEFDLVLVDAPPLLQVAYASTLASLVDTVLVLVAHGGSATQLEEARSRLNLIGVPILGYVYNGSPLRREMTISEGSTADVLGDMSMPKDDGEKRKSGFVKRWQR